MEKRYKKAIKKKFPVIRYLRFANHKFLHFS